MTRGVRSMALVHFVGNALMLWLAYYWLGVGESRTLTLLWSALVALVVVLFACLLHGGAFALFRKGEGIGAAFRTALAHLAPLVVVALLIVVVYGMLSWWASYSTTPAFSIASWLTLKLRKPVRPNTVMRVFNVGLWLVRWVLVPVIVVPLASWTASLGWRGFGRMFTGLRIGRYWVLGPVLLLIALWVPLWMLAWIPKMSSFGLEMTSFIARAVVAYLLFTAGWLALEFVTSAGSPVFSQPKTEAKP